MAVRKNRDILTKGQKYHEKSKNFKKRQVEEVVFDKSSRLDYLTGFHKRKVERQRKAQEFNKEQERLAKIEARKRTKQEREEDTRKQLEDFKKGMKEVGDYVGSDDDEKTDVLPGSKDTDDESEEEWAGFEENDDDDDERASAEEENNAKSYTYEDPHETKSILKRKTVYEDDTNVEVETLEPNDNFEFIAKLNNVNLEKSEDILNSSINRASKYAKFMGMHDENDDKAESKNKKKEPKQKKKKFRYLTKGERRDNQRKAAQNKNRRK
ncbi:hypothetical protein ACO0RG_003989 [Hanseniaspora osmophila]